MSPKFSHPVSTPELNGVVWRELGTIFTSAAAAKLRDTTVLDRLCDALVTKGADLLGSAQEDLPPDELQQVRWIS